ncbi:sensor histidine kinase [Plantactinospora soyae]|uniref:histidine kinase n=1 Tax=Plantactinospora soyae TaxID=1544732 RepID=A0A927MHS5_9ACTN|nr:histidine kinase [Plantactinospora soyae]MBE1491395.1 signal transduction histidine kinase [Plantactinospora soyae]
MRIRGRAAGRTVIAVDVALAALFGAVLVGQAVAIRQSWGGDYWQFEGVAGLVVCVTALLRRRHRAWSAVAGLAVAAVAILVARLAGLPGEPGLAMVLGLSVLVGSAIRTLPVRLAGAVAAGGLAVVAGTRLGVLPSSSGAVVGLNVAGWLTAVGVGLGLRLLDARRRATADQVRREERLELARELHDVVAHHITGIVIQAQAAQIVARKRPEQVRESLVGIEAAGSEALTAMRRVVGLLRDTDDAAPASPGPEQLSELVRRFDGPGRTVRLSQPDAESAWPPEVTSTVYRVVQESLTNISRHAPHAHSVTVSIAQDPRAITVEVVDDAPLAPARYPHLGGYGLIGMRERVETLGGTLHAGPGTGAGWSVRATLPAPDSR